MQVFSLLYRLEDEDRFLIWISDEEDSVLVDAQGFIPSFADTTSLRAYADRIHYALEDETPILHDLDWIVSWTPAPDAQIDCNKALAAWNLFIDVAHSVPEKGVPLERLDAQLLNIYNKIFRGNNLPAITPKGERYVPIWSPEEIASLAEILAVGLDLFRSCTRPFPPE